MTRDLNTTFGHHPYIFAAKPPPYKPSPLGKGDRTAVDRVLSYIAYLRRSPSLSFIPPVPYPPLRGTFPSRGRQCVGDSGILVSQPSPLGKGDRAAVDRVLSYIAYLRRSSSLSFIPLVLYPPLRGTFPTRGRLCVEDTAFPLQPPPLRGTSFQRKEGASTRAPSLGRGC